ncbi:ATP-dependent DNA ligase [soil metagenome]
MKQFAELFLQLDRTNKTNEKVALLKSYFLLAPEEDKIWALALFTGRRPPRPVKAAQLQSWAMELAGIPQWLYRESYNAVGDMAETISLLLPVSISTTDKSLADWCNQLATLTKVDDATRKEFILDAWHQLSPFETFVFNKLMMGSFRVGVSQTLVIRSIAEATEQEATLITHRVMGDWNPFKISFNHLIQAVNASDQVSKPYPFYLAYALEGTLEELGNREDWFVEWKWDGIRAQIIFRQNQLYIWSRGEELVTDKFPELVEFKKYLADGTVLDGEIVCFHDGKPLPFNVLQTRIGRKNVTKKILQEAPVVFIAYDILEYHNQDVRSQPQEKRRTLVKAVYDQAQSPSVFHLSELVEFTSWDDVRKLHTLSREKFVEGFMIKRKDAAYQTGRRKGDWWKWKIDPLTIDAVLIYAQKGHGRRAEFYSDYTFAVWDNDKLIPFAKAYSGLTDAEIKEVDRFVKQNTLEKFGPVRTVKPALVFEIGFEGIATSSRHKSGIAVRFPRMLQWRKDKAVEEADTLETLKMILESTK